MDLDGITMDEIKESLSLKINRRQVFKAGEGAGASGSFFFFSKDKRLIIKTIKRDEKKVLLSILDSFIDYI